MMPKTKRSHTHINGTRRSLTPLETLVLESFSDSDAALQDSVTVAQYLHRGAIVSPRRFRELERLAEAVLADLLAMGCVESDRSGWLRIAKACPIAASPRVPPSDAEAST